MPDVTRIDSWDDGRILTTLLDGQQHGLDAVRRALPAISAAAGATAERVRAGGRMIYAGAGASIRIAVQDGSELHATFGMPERQVAYLIAGGRSAMFATLADAEDDAEDGRNQAGRCTAQDVVIAVAASGSTPFTVAAAERARELGALVVAVVNNPSSMLTSHANHEILLQSGAEVIAGSTRMGAGTAQKAALNLFSTLVHIRLGAVHDGLMVNLQPGNEKLRNRAVRIVSQIARIDEVEASAALTASENSIKIAVLLCAGAKSGTSAENILAEAGGNLRLALSRIRSQ